MIERHPYSNRGRVPVSFLPYVGEAGVSTWRGRVEVAFKADIEERNFVAGREGSIDGAPFRIVEAHRSKVNPAFLVLVVEEIGNA